jgi:Ca-activated chloride channel family protein
MTQVRDFTFYHPEMAWTLLVLIPLLLLQIYLISYRKKQIHAFSDPTLQPLLLIHRSQAVTLLKLMGWCLIGTLTCLALMDPIGNLRYRNIPSNGPLQESTTDLKYRPQEVVFLVDTSASMSVKDGPSDETRLNLAKEIMENMLRQLKGPTVSLYSMTSILTPIVPATMDYLFVRLMIKGLHFDEGDVGGTLYQPVLTELFKKALPNTNKIYSLIILSDGGDTSIEALQGDAQKNALTQILNTLPGAKDLNLRVFTIGIGSATPQPIPRVTKDGKAVQSALEPKLLKLLAKKGQGEYFQASEETPWNLAQQIVEQITQDPPFIQNQAVSIRKVVVPKPDDLIYDLYFQIPLGIAILLLLGILILPDTGRR